MTCVFLLNLPSSTAFSQIEQGISDDQKVGFFLDNQWKTGKISVNIINNLVIVQFLINEELDFNFILDSGVKVPMILDNNLDDFFTAESKRNVKVKGMGPDEAIEAQLVTVRNLRIGMLQGQNINFVILPKNTFNLSQHVGIRIDGIIGYDVFKNLKVEVNYQSKWIRFYDPRFKLRKKQFTRVPIEIRSYKPYLSSLIESNLDKEDCLLMIDSGASNALTVLDQKTGNIRLPKENISAYLGTGVSGDLNGNIARIDRLGFTNFEFAEVITAFPDTSSIRHYSKNRERTGSIGGEILRRFHVVFDYPNECLWMKRNQDYNRPFAYNKSGILVNAVGNEFQTFLIAEVSENSPAAEVGLKVGDQIVEINNVKKLGLGEIYNQLNLSKEGKVIKMKVLRGYDFLSFKVKLRSQI